MANEVVAHLADGTLIKGVCLDVDLARPTCHIKTPDRGVVAVKLAELKALFFVKDLTGDPARQEGQELSPTDPRARGTYPIDLQFRDGERVVGLTNRYPPNRPFFFVLPADPQSNNLRILVNRAALASLSAPSAGPSQASPS
jgi:hypothetical protein